MTDFFLGIGTGLLLAILNILLSKKELPQKVARFFTNKQAKILEPEVEIDLT